LLEPGLDDPDLDELGLLDDDPGLPAGFDVPRYDSLDEFREPPGRALDEREEEDGRSFDMADHATAGSS